jgi:hypothetical protein
MRGEASSMSLVGVVTVGPPGSVLSARADKGEMWQRQRGRRN